MAHIYGESKSREVGNSAYKTWSLPLLALQAKGTENTLEGVYGGQLHPRVIFVKAIVLGL